MVMSTVRIGTFIRIGFGRLDFLLGVLIFSIMTSAQPIDIDGHMGINNIYGRRYLNMPTGTFEIFLIDENNVYQSFTQQFAPQEYGHNFELNLLGGFFNDLAPLWIKNGNTPLWQNLYGYFGMRMSFMLMANGEAMTGRTILFDIGADFGLRYHFGRRLYISPGVKLIPLSMATTSLIEFYVDGMQLSTGNYSGVVSGDMLSTSIGVSPFITVGCYLTKKFPLISLDFSIGRQYHWSYFQNYLHSSPLYNNRSGEDEWLDVYLEFNGQPFNSRLISFSGHELRIGLTFLFD
jgi:hypothetical protein